jgi:hypothetical protein
VVGTGTGGVGTLTDGTDTVGSGTGTWPRAWAQEMPAAKSAARPAADLTFVRTIPALTTPNEPQWVRATLSREGV